MRRDEQRRAAVAEHAQFITVSPSHNAGRATTIGHRSSTNFPLVAHGQKAETQLSLSMNIHIDSVALGLMNGNVLVPTIFKKKPSKAAITYILAYIDSLLPPVIVYAGHDITEGR